MSRSASVACNLNKRLVYYCIRRTPQTKDLPDALIDAFARHPDVARSR